MTNLRSYDIGDKERRMFEMGAFGAMVVDVRRVNLEDVCESNRPGAIIRVDGNPSECIKFLPVDSPQIGCVAGWISEDE